MLKKIFKRGLIAFISMLGIFLLSLVFGARYPMDKSVEEIEAKYLLNSSSFKTIDGVNIHYTDQGTGPVVLLLHANYANLIDWNPWVTKLSSDYRVIRLDIPGHGLTEADSSNDYSMSRTLFIWFRIQNMQPHIDIISPPPTSIGRSGGVLYIYRHFFK